MSASKVGSESVPIRTIRWPNVEAIRIPGVARSAAGIHSITRQGRPIRCLLVGYNGAGNTGSDIRLFTAIDDVRAAFGPQTHITVTSINPDRTAANLPRDLRVKVEELNFTPHQFLPTVWGLTRSHDVTILIEGSAFTQNWSPWLLHAYLWTAEYARWNGNHAIAYAVDVGNLDPFHAFWARNIIERMSLVITRTDVARQRLVKLGVRRPVQTTTDTAFRYVRQADRGVRARPLVGMAPIEFFQWPIRLQFACPPEARYKWPLAFTWNSERRAHSEAMLERWVSLARHALDVHDVDLQLIAMEDLDTPICEKIQDSLGASLAERVSVASAHHVQPSDMVGILRGLDALVTSRYHACVLSMGGSVPQMAIGHDERLSSIYSELGIRDDYLLDYRHPQLSQCMLERFDRLMGEREALAMRIRETHDSEFVPRCSRNQTELRAWGLQTFDRIKAAA